MDVTSRGTYRGFGYVEKHEAAIVAETRIGRVFYQGECPCGWTSEACEEQYRRDAERQTRDHNRYQGH